MFIILRFEETYLKQKNKYFLTGLFFFSNDSQLLQLERLEFSTSSLRRLSKFEVPVVVNLKHIFDLFSFTPFAF